MITYTRQKLKSLNERYNDRTGWSSNLPFQEKSSISDAYAFSNNEEAEQDDLSE